LEYPYQGNASQDTATTEKQWKKAPGTSKIQPRLMKYNSFKSQSVKPWSSTINKKENVIAAVESHQIS
jgi:hypothetical protein